MRRGVGVYRGWQKLAVTAGRRAVSQRMAAQRIRPFLATTSSKRAYCGFAEEFTAQEGYAPADFKAQDLFPDYLLHLPPTQVTTLPNQFRVASERRVGDMATVGVWIDAGSVWETEENNGVAHFLEHMAFKGTQRRTQRSLELEIENIGGSLNAYTSREQTVYYAHVFKDDVPQAVDILADILQNSKFDEADITREREVILREMEEVESQTEEVIFDHLHSVAFQGTSLGYTILGPEKNIRSIGKKDLQDYIGTHYRGRRMVLAAAGAVDHNQLVELAEKHFGNVPDQEHKLPEPEQLYTPSAVNIRINGMPLLHAAVAVRGVSWTDPDYFVFMLFQTLVGNWDRSVGGGGYLMSKTCEDIAAVGDIHSLMSFNTCYRDAGLFGAYFTGKPGEDMYQATKIVIDNWVRIAKDVSEQEVERAKNKLKSTFLMQLDGSSAIAEDIGRQLLTIGRRMTPAEICLRIDSIDRDTVRRVAMDYLYDVDPSVAAIGEVDTAKFPDMNSLRAWTTWWRY